MNEEADKTNVISLYLKTDDKYEKVRSEVLEMSKSHQDLKNTLDRIEKRVDFGVSVTGQKNAEELGKQAVEIGKLKQTQELEQLKLTTLEKNLGDKLEKIIKSVDLIYKGIVGIFFTVLCGGGILWAMKYLHLS